jgi:hypothetical protein
VKLRVSHIRRFVRAMMREVFSGISTRSRPFGQPAGELVPIRKRESKLPIEGRKGKLGPTGCSNIPVESKIAAMLKRYQLSNYATAFGFRQARVYTVGCGSAFAGHSGKLRPAEHLPQDFTFSER